MTPIVLIPARMAATRLPGKPLADIFGSPMIVRVLRQAEAAGIGPVAVAAGDSEIVDAVRAALANAKGPVLAFCRSGTRSIVTWSLGEAMAGARARGELVSLGRDAGYDLSGVLGG